MATTSSAIAAAARPAARLDGLPVDLLAHVALYIGHRDGRKLMVQGLLALRVASSTCKDSVRRAAKEHAFLQSADWRLPAGVTARKIAVWGRVFGSGCRKLHLWGGHDQSEVPSPEVLDALQSFVVNTQGRLRDLDITYLRFSNSRDYALELCRASPRLKELNLRWTPSGWGDGHGVTSAAIDSFAMEVSRLCPLLEKVELTDGYSPIGRISPAETWQRHFPSLRCLDFYRDPSRYAAIEETVRACARADEMDLIECTVLPAFVDMLLRTPLRGRLRKLDVSHETTISTDTILQCARGFELLTHLSLPDDFSAGPEFYRSLLREQPTLTNLFLGFSSLADDACLRVVCNSSLEHLALPLMDNLSPEVIDIILQSPSAQTLRHITIYYMHEVFNPPSVLRLIRGCPLLRRIEWDHDLQLSPIEDGPTIDAINELIMSRGGGEKDLVWRPVLAARDWA